MTQRVTNPQSNLRKRKCAGYMLEDYSSTKTFNAFHVVSLPYVRQMSVKSGKIDCFHPLKLTTFDARLKLSTLRWAYRCVIVRSL